MSMSERERIEDEHGASAALGMAMAFVMMLCLCGCNSEPLAKTWPEVADKHWFVCGCLMAWVVCCLTLSIGGIKVRLKKSDGTP